jgi:hypothetical protein
MRTFDCGEKPLIEAVIQPLYLLFVLSSVRVGSVEAALTDPLGPRASVVDTVGVSLGAAVSVGSKVAAGSGVSIETGVSAGIEVGIVVESGSTSGVGSTVKIVSTETSAATAMTP